MDNLRLLILILFFFPLHAQANSSLLSKYGLSSNSSGQVSQVNTSLQTYYSQTTGLEASPPTINDDGTITYRFNNNGTVVNGSCNQTGCVSTGPVTCEGNQVGNLDGSCRCADGYEYAPGRSASVCIETPTCPAGTFMTGHIESVCQCENNIHQTIAVGAPNTCVANIDVVGNCGSDPREDGFPNPVAVQAFIDCTEAERQAEIDAQRLENQSVAANNAAVDAQNNLDTAIASEAATLAQSCNAAVQSFNSSCSSVRRIPQANTDTSGATTKERCESLSQTSKSGIESVKADISRCVAQFNSLSSKCPSNTSNLTGNGEATVSDRADELGNDVVATEASSKSGSGAVPGVSGMIAEASQVNSQLVAQGAQVEQELAKLEESSAQCIAALEDKPDNDPTANKFLNQAQSFAGSALSGSGSYKGGSYGGSELGSSGSGYSTGKAFGETAKNVYDKLRGRDSGSLNPTGSLGDNMSGIADEAALGNGNGGQAYSPTGGPSGSASGGAKTTSAGNFGSSSSGKSKVGANSRKKRRGKTAKARNLAQGYKTMKASDGGSSFSIKPSSFKKFGSKALKQKLAAARKLHGKDMPLIFRNGKFVLDFLAMKEARKFKARNVAMENRLKGGNGDVEKELFVHENSRLNIFRIMNFRYQRQKFHEQ